MSGCVEDCAMESTPPDYKCDNPALLTNNGYNNSNTSVTWKVKTYMIA